MKRSWLEMHMSDYVELMAIAAPFCVFVFIIGVTAVVNVDPGNVKSPEPIEIVEEDFDIDQELFPSDPVPVPVALPDVDPEQLSCLALNMWFEAANTSELDRLATAHTVINRVKDRRWPDSICGVVRKGKHWKNPHTGNLVPIRYACHFTWYCDGKSDKVKLTDHKGRVIKGNVRLWNEIQEVAWNVIAGNTQDPTNGATHYYNPRAVEQHPVWDHPDWKDDEKLTLVTIGHNFYNI